ncbi:MAG: thiamine pyrophosphate-dependent enzyme [Candidatus Binatia bacterium]|jgi:thiamine pyrophosphate-dependent acetolactate synthase large subunit-like protein|nr:thiamine pyrophosphate-dependent enzyme [Candidatus Binatia bacterium]
MWNLKSVLSFSPNIEELGDHYFGRSNLTDVVEDYWDMDRVLHLGASMSMISMFGAGIASGAPKLPVWVFMGDGAFVMNSGTLMIERDLNLPNLRHFLVSNRVYNATGGVRLPNIERNDYAAMARAMGIERLNFIDSMKDLKAKFDSVVN